MLNQDFSPRSAALAEDLVARVELSLAAAAEVYAAAAAVEPVDATEQYLVVLG